MELKFILPRYNRHHKQRLLVEVFCRAFTCIDTIEHPQQSPETRQKQCGTLKRANQRAKEPCDILTCGATKPFTVPVQCTTEP